MNKFKHILFSTTKVDKIILAFNSLYPEEKDKVLTDEDIKERLLDINNISLIIYLLLNSNKSIKDNYLISLNNSTKDNEHDEALLEYLSLTNYSLFPISKLQLLSSKNDNYLLFEILKNYPNKTLETIIIEIDSQDIKDLAFIIYEKEEKNLELSNSIIKAISPNTLDQVFKRRKKKKKETSLSFEDFILIDDNKKNIVLGSSNIPDLEKQLSTYLEAGIHSEGVVREYSSRIVQRVNYLNTVYLRTAIKNSNNPHEQLNRLLKEYYGINIDIDPFYLDKLNELLVKPTILTEKILSLLKQDPYVFFNYLLTNEEDHSLEQLNKTTTIEQYIKQKRLDN